MALFIITAPSGAGKTTLVRYLQKTCTWNEVISHTTRPMREGEVEGVTYYYIDKRKFHKMHNDNELAEKVVYGDNWYGISKKEIKRVEKLGRHIVVIAEKSGYRQLKAIYPDAVGIFLYASKEECMENMLGRGDSMRDALKRIDMYESEIVNYDYDYTIRNVKGQLDATADILIAITQQYPLEVK